MTLSFDPRKTAATLYTGQFCPLFIDGKHVPAQSGEVLNVTDPACGRGIATVPRASASDVDTAVAAARRAFEGARSKFTPL